LNPVPPVGGVDHDEDVVAEERGRVWGHVGDPSQAQMFPDECVGRLLDGFVNAPTPVEIESNVAAIVFVKKFGRSGSVDMPVIDTLRQSDHTGSETVTA
jgi:hypothetical protein